MRGTDTGIVLGLYRSGCERSILEGALSLGVTALDTSYSYLGFRSHSVLAAVAADLLPEFSISTKIGFFPGPERSVHSLDPHRLREALERTCDDLGRAPDLVFLHNPERSLARLPLSEGRARFAAACVVLRDAVTAGQCGAWGIASWDPRVLCDLLHEHPPDAPDVLMTRAGLLVSHEILRASEALAASFDLPVRARWGMSPFGGNAHNPIWQALDTRPFLAPGEDHYALHAAFRVSYYLPVVSTIAVGTSDPDHLRNLVTARTLRVDDQAIHRYRQLLEARAKADASQPRPA